MRFLRRILAQNNFSRTAYEVREKLTFIQGHVDRESSGHGTLVQNHLHSGQRIHGGSLHRKKAFQETSGIQETSGRYRG